MLMTVLFAILGVALIALRRSAYGRMIVAMKDSPAACATLGLNIVRLKLGVFMVSSGIAGLAGVMWACQQRTLANNNGFDGLARALKNWGDSRRGCRKGRLVGFPRFKQEGSLPGCLSVHHRRDQGAARPQARSAPTDRGPQDP